MWGTKALDKVRRRTLEHSGSKDGNARWAVIRNPEHLTPEQRGSLARIKTTNTVLYRAYLLKEQLRAVFATTARRAERCWQGGSQGAPLPARRVRQNRPHHSTVPAADLEHPQGTRYPTPEPRPPIPTCGR